MSRKRIAVIDSGISTDVISPEKIVESYILIKKDSDIYSVIEGDSVDYIGHGTARLK